MRRVFGQKSDQPLSWFALEGGTGAWRSRVAYAEYWEALFKVMEDKFRRLGSAYGAVCCHKFKPKNQTDDIFLAQNPRS